MPKEARALLMKLRHQATDQLVRMRDPRLINPMYVFAGGLSVLVPIWLLFLNR
jgi:hypothetical protein